MAASSPNPTILIIDDDREIRYSLERVFSSRNYRVLTAASGEEGIEIVRQSSPDVVFLDVRLGGISGLETLQHLGAAEPAPMVILMTAYGTTQTAIEAMKFGAFDYLMKPFDTRKVLRLTEGALKASADLRSAGEHRPLLDSDDYREGIVGKSEAMQTVFKVIGRVAASDATVLITGESGTGKELVARCLVRHSRRDGGPYVTVNCAALPENLIESELFGHERGAFTGATARRPGRFELCDGGTIFLDEIGDMPLSTQTRILRVIQEGEFQRVGGTETLRTDVRILAATNRDLEEMVREKTFREDLYYRLNVVRIRLPPLRERREDIPELLEYCVQKLGKARKAKVRKISSEARELLMRHDWPGNVRELENVIHRSAVLAQGDTILVRDLPEEIRRPGPAPAAAEEAAAQPAAEEPPGAGRESRAAVVHGAEPRAPEPPAPPGKPAPASLEGAFDLLYNRMREESRKPVLETLERGMILRALRETGGNQVRASAILGITRATLRKRIEQFSLRDEL